MKRNVFSELTEGFGALKAERDRQNTLRTHAVVRKPAPAVTSKELMRIRQSLKRLRSSGKKGAKSSFWSAAE